MCPPESIASLTEGTKDGNTLVGYRIEDNTEDIIPKDKVSLAAYNHVKAHLEPTILAHSLRVFLYARSLSERALTRDHLADRVWHTPKRLPLLFTACMFHDFGTTSLHDDKPSRFEVEGANAARSFLRHHGFSHADSHAIWIAIACHTSPHIGEQISDLARLIRFGPLMDFHRFCPEQVRVVDEVPAVVSDDSSVWILSDEVRQVESLLPRDQIEKVLAEKIVVQAKREGMSGKAPDGTWPGGLLRAEKENPGWEGVNKAFF